MLRSQPDVFEPSQMLFKWTTELSSRLAFIRAKFLAKCILERAAYSAEKQDNIDGITHEVRPPLPHQLHVFAAHRHENQRALPPQ